MNNITMIILKSGTKINTANADEIEVVLRQENYVELENNEQKKKVRYRTWIRVTRPDKVYEIKEDEVAAFEYENVI